MGRRTGRGCRGQSPNHATHLLGGERAGRGGGRTWARTPQASVKPIPTPSASRRGPTALPRCARRDDARRWWPRSMPSAKNAASATRSYASGQSSTTSIAVPAAVITTASSHSARNHASPRPQRVDATGAGLPSADRPRGTAVALEQAAGRLGNQHRVAGPAGRLLDARGDVDRSPMIPSSSGCRRRRSDDDRPGVDADADPAASPKCASTAPRSPPARPRGRRGRARLGRAEHAEHPVAEELARARRAPPAPGHDAEELVSSATASRALDAVGNGVKSRMSTNSAVDHRVLAVHGDLRSHRKLRGLDRLGDHAAQRRRAPRGRARRAAVPERLERCARRSGGGRSAGRRRLDARPHRAEQRRHGKGRHRHGEAGVPHREPDQQHQPEVDGAERRPSARRRPARDRSRRRCRQAMAQDRHAAEIGISGSSGRRGAAGQAAGTAGTRPSRRRRGRRSAAPARARRPRRAPEPTTSDAPATAGAAG